MFFKLKLYENSGKALHFASDCAYDVSDLAYGEFIAASLAALGRDTDGCACKKITFHHGFPASLKEKIRRQTELSPSKEAYAVVLGETTKIYATSEQGFIYAVSTLTQLSESGELCCGLLYDYPMMGTRGYRVYLPARSGFEEFFKMVDFLALYKFNSIILEIGGAMEYKRHPEIGERWAEFCREVHAYSGRAHEIQRGYAWDKNSIHCDNAEGDVLTQEECATLAAYCRSRGLEVIPECPTFSHCDYIVMAHPEIRERERDDYPDTYCPNHPDSYKYVFDVLEEVIDVFHPTRINIGHDEMYSIGICPRCKKKTPPQLYADDIHKIHDFLAERGIQTMMWGEKLLNARYIPGSGMPIGGAAHGKGEGFVPALYPCRNLLPKDVTFLHWYWCFNYKHDRVYHDRGYKMIYGNLTALDLEHWDMRREWGADGGFVSNWGSFKEDYMQRNKQYLDLISGAYAFWCEDFGSRTLEENLFAAMREANRLKRARTAHPLTITHTTTHHIRFAHFYDGVFIEDSKYLLGHYKLRYTDGTEAELPVRYGTHLAADHFDDYLRDSEFRQTSYSTMPCQYNGGLAYACVYENPYPEKKLCSIAYEPVAGKEDISVEMISFSVSDSNAAASIRTETVGFAGADFAWDGAR